MDEISQYKELLAKELVTDDQSLIFKFEFIRVNSGVIRIVDKVNDTIKNATFSLELKDGVCFLRILTRDFEILFENGVRREIYQEIHSAIDLITNGLFSFEKTDLS